MMKIARMVPPIHDVTTDTANPPRFVDIIPLRAKAVNSAVYEGDKIAVLQVKAYPDIQPLVLSTLPDETFDRALMSARKLKWNIVATNRSEGRIEATDTTFWMGFKDDIVIRIAANDTGSRLDIRSESRVGKGDFGKNADRIRKFFKVFKSAA